MNEQESLKIAVIFFLFGFVAPVLGFVLKLRPPWQRWAFALLCFTTTGGIFQAADWALTLQFYEYRGHAKGYHFYFAEVPALALVFARAFEDWREFRFFPPGLWLYLLYCALSLASIIHAPEPDLVLKAGFKFVKITLVFVAAYNFLTSEKRVHFFLTAMALTIGWQFIVVLKMKYAEGIYQAPGTFEHQNSLSMFITMIGLLFLAVALGPPHPRSKFYLLAFLACAFIQQSTLSRGGLAIFSAGTVAVVLPSLLARPTRQRLAMLSVLTLAGMIGLGMTLDTIIGRFRDQSNQSSEITRALLNQAARDMLADYPLGIGWNNFGKAINKPFPYGDIIDQYERDGGVRVDPTHQKGIVEGHYYLLLSETGYQGLIFYLLFILVFLWWNIRAAIFYRHRFLGAVSLGIGAGCAFNYLHSIFERVLTQPRNLLLWMLFLGLTARIEWWRRITRQAQKE